MSEFSADPATYNPFPWMDRPDPLPGEIDAMFERTDDAYDYVDVALDDAALRALEPPGELIPGWVPLVGVAGIWAPPGYMKTFILTGMAKAVRRGKRWQHRHEPVRRKGGVLFFEGEVPQQLAERQDAFDLRYPLVGGRESPQWTIPSTPDLTTVAGVAATIRTAEAFKEKLRAEDDDLAMVVFDPLPEYFTGEEVGDGLVRAVRALCWIAERLQCSVVVGHQSNAGGGRARGHDIFRQKVFVLAHIERPEPDLIALVQDKNKFRPELALTLAVTEVGPSIVLEYERGGDGDLLAHEYLAEKEQKVAGARTRRKSQAQSQERTQAKEVAKAVMTTKGLYAGDWFPSLRSVMAAMREADASLSERSCREAIEGLIASGDIEPGDKGKQSRIPHRWAS